MAAFRSPRLTSGLSLSGFVPSRAARALMGAGLLALLAGPAAASPEWRYCLATWEPTHSVYVTMPFHTEATLVVLEDAYSAYLDAHGIRHEPVICPRAATEDLALAAREQAIAYNRTLGMTLTLAAWRYGG